MVYVFKRNKKTGRKTIIRTDFIVEDARRLCKIENNNSNNICWYEFSKYREYAEN